MGPDTDFIIVLTTFPVDGDEPAQAVEQLARTLVDERLAGCVNILAPMRSIYSWKGQIETANERQLVIKTTRARLDGARNRAFSALHPYDTPEFLVIPVADGSATI